MRRLLVLAGIAGLVTTLGPPAAVTAAPEPTRLTIEAPSDARTGEPHEVGVTLTDVRGEPLAGETIAVSEEVRFFDYRDMTLVAEVRTNHQGRATVTHVPGVVGPGRLTAEYAGSAELAPAADAVTIAVEEGVGVVSPVLPGPPEPLLPRGVTAVWFLPLLLGVWVAIAAAVYNALRIPVEREAPNET